MECYYHPSRESTDRCAICGKSICKECGLEMAGKVYCKECLERIVGMGLENKQEQVEEEPMPPEKQDPAEDIVERSNLTTPEPEEVTKIPEDSPYNIRSNIQYESGLESRYDQPYPQEQYSPQERIPQQQEQYPSQKRTPQQQEQYPPQDRIPQQRERIPQRPVQNVREEYIQQEPIQQARNEYDYIPKQDPMAQSQDYIYPDHSYEPQKTSARQDLETKYERYLDDLYFDEEEVPLDKQLELDEAKYGSLTRNEYRPRNSHEQQRANDQELDRRIHEELSMREGQPTSSRYEKIHRKMDYKEEKEPYGAVDILLTIILIILIIIVLFYILYIFKLNATYPTFIDALYGLKNPGKFMSALL